MASNSPARTFLLALFLFTMCQVGLSGDSLNVFSPYPALLRYTHLTEEEQLFYRSETFPLSLAEKGRPSAIAHRGMPPGFFQFRLDGHPLQNPILGFWDAQWLPHFRSQGFFSGGIFREEHLKTWQPPSSDPVSLINFHQDFVFGLSYLDIGFQRRFGPSRVVQLGGNNFLREGTEPLDFSNIQLNTYQVKLHWPLPHSWKMDVRLRQNRHRFKMTPEVGFFSTADKFKRVGNGFWINFLKVYHERDSLIITPEWNLMEDNYWRQGQLVRHLHYGWMGSRLRYLWGTAEGSFGLEMSGYRNWQGETWRWKRQSEYEFQVSSVLNHRLSIARLQALLGYRFHNKIGGTPLAGITMELPVYRNWRLKINGFVRSEPLPLLWRTFRGDTATVKRLEDEYLHQQGAVVGISGNAGHPFFWQIEGFALRALHYPAFDEAGSQWHLRNPGNIGVQVKAGIRLWKFTIINDVSYNHHYRLVFAPRLNNIFSLQARQSMFNGALRLVGSFYFHSIDRFRPVQFNRLLNLYQLGDGEAGPYHLMDFKLQAEIKKATLFFVWENLLSEDYSIVEGTLEYLRQFRLGIRWNLMD